MKTVGLLLVGIFALSVCGCGSSSDSGSTDEAKMHQMLSGPPSLAGMNKKPKGAKQPAGNKAQPPPGSSASSSSASTGP